jgi:hypothetical protein
VTIIAIVSVLLNCTLFGWVASLYRENNTLQRENIELEEKAGKYYMRLLGEASKKDA